MPSPGAPSAGISRREPVWWVRDVVLGVTLVLLGALAAGWLDDRRSDREQRAADLLYVRSAAGTNQLVILDDGDLHDQPLAGLNLHQAHLLRANLSGANLRSSILDAARLNGANLAGADLFYADLRYADLHGADLRGANLGGATLARADLRGADLTGATMLPPGMGAKSGSVKDDQKTWAMTFGKGACWDEHTTWAFTLEPPANNVCASDIDVGTTEAEDQAPTSSSTPTPTP